MFMKENILVVCYSYSGKTRMIAEVIERQTGGTRSQIYPRQPYPADFEQLLSQVRMENRTGKYPALLPVTERADNYDIVFTGSPNWCGTIAPPLVAWLKENDMTGKILLPFFSHCGGEDKGMEQAVCIRKWKGKSAGDGTLLVETESPGNLGRVMPLPVEEVLKK